MEVTYGTTHEIINITKLVNKESVMNSLMTRIKHLENTIDI